MILLILMVSGALTLFLYSANSNKLRIERDKKTDAALAQAKEALIGYAAIYRESHPNQVYGYLPCPDPGLGPLVEGTAAGSCSSKNVTVIGRLPWKTLNLPSLRDGNGECLWYAVSGNFKNNTNTDMMSWDTNGLIQIYASDGTTLIAGNTLPDNAAAVIFSPGLRIAGQDRTPNGNTPECGGNNTPANYLDTDTVSGISNSLVNPIANGISKMMTAAFFSNSSGNTSVNDKLAYITPNEIFARHIVKRTDFSDYLSNPNTPYSLLRQVATCLANPALPWAVPKSLANYGNNNLYAGTPSTYAGRAPYNQVQACINSNIPNDQWWQNWKDNIFYEVSKASKAGNACTSSADCLTVNGGLYAAVVIFSGKKLDALNQLRNINNDKANFANYLEDDNLATFNNNTGQGSIKFNASTPTFNDTVICINQSFTVVPNCNAP